MKPSIGRRCRPDVWRWPGYVHTRVVSGCVIAFTCLPATALLTQATHRQTPSYSVQVCSHICPSALARHTRYAPSKERKFTCSRFASSRMLLSERHGTDTVCVEYLPRRVCHADVYSYTQGSKPKTSAHIDTHFMTHLYTKETLRSRCGGNTCSVSIFGFARTLSSFVAQRRLR